MSDPFTYPEAMISSDKSPIAVFLGPSLSVQVASTILDARYLPPARFGDVYRLIGSDVRTVILIDGVFHGHAPVWQRELLYAMQSGVHVYGASSMGALRAAELHQDGMIGVGSVFQSYVAGEIDGDDEVALLHADAEQMYRPLSEALVNLRFNLREAIARGILDHEQAASLIAAMKAMPFWQRTREALWRTPACRALDEARRARLRAFFLEHAIDRKREDAILVLSEAARRQDEPEVIAISTAPTAKSAVGPWLTSSYHDHFRLMRRAVPRGDGLELDGGALVHRVLSDPGRRRLLTWALGAQFFVGEWARESGLRIPADELAAMEAEHKSRVPIPAIAAFRRANRLTQAEHQSLLSKHLLWRWILAQPPERFGLSPSLHYEELWPQFPELGPLRPVCEGAHLARSLPYVAAFCQMVGAAPGPKAREALTGHFGVALRAIRERHGPEPLEPLLVALWAINKSPTYFGYTTWLLSAELFCELQIAGTVAELAAAWEATVA